MPLTPDEFAEACKQSCKHCATGNVPRYRTDSQEYVHDFTTRASFSHTFCAASGLRKAYEQGTIGGKDG